MKPILFNTEMVQAILNNRKGQTRRPVVPQPVVEGDEPRWTYCMFSTIKGSEDKWHLDVLDPKGHQYTDRGCERNICAVKAPYETGEVLYVRETWTTHAYNNICHKADDVLVYKADGDDWDEQYEGWRWRPSIHMPKWAARLFLKVKSVRVERVQDISELDARAEGVSPCRWYIPPDDPNEGYQLQNFTEDELVYLDGIGLGCYRKADISWRNDFANLWNSVYEKRGNGWDANPYVWVTEFERCDPERSE